MFTKTNLVARNQLIGSSFTSARSARGVICPIVGDLRWGHGKKAEPIPCTTHATSYLITRSTFVTQRGAIEGKKYD